MGEEEVPARGGGVGEPAGCGGGAAPPRPPRRIARLDAAGNAEVLALRGDSDRLREANEALRAENARLRAQPPGFESARAAAELRAENEALRAQLERSSLLPRAPQLEP